MERWAYIGPAGCGRYGSMARVAAQRTTSRRRTVGIAVGAALLVLLLIAGLAFANSISVTNVTNNAKSLHWTNAALGTSALARAGLVQAVTFGELEENGRAADRQVPAPGGIGLLERTTGIFLSGDIVYDGSLRTQLEQLREQLR